MKYFAKVNGDPVITSMTITSDESDTRGFFVYYQAGADTFDTWHPTLAEAFSMGDSYGINHASWKLLGDQKGAEVFIHAVFITSTGIVCLLDYPKDTGPKIGQLLVNRELNEVWTVTGIGMGQFADRLNPPVDSPYQSPMIRDCLLKPAISTARLAAGDILVIR